MFLTNTPTYFKEVLKFDVQTDGFLSSIPYAILAFVVIASGFVSDKLISSKRFSKNNVRKFFTIGCNIILFKVILMKFSHFFQTALIIPVIAIVGLSFVTCEETDVAVGLLTFGIGIG